jgi:hypothetical protein
MSRNVPAAAALYRLREGHGAALRGLWNLCNYY